MKSICCNIQGVIQIRRLGYIAFYQPTKSSRRRFVKLALKDQHEKQYETFRVFTAAGFSSDIWEQVIQCNSRGGAVAAHQSHNLEVAGSNPAPASEGDYVESNYQWNEADHKEQPADSASAVQCAEAMPDEGLEKPDAPANQYPPHSKE
jgi:hypothetical protein